MNGVFLSFSGEDQLRVEEVRRALPEGLVRIYTHSFIDGQTLLGEMQRHVIQCTAFVFMASAASLSSVWCRHEINLAQVESIRRDLPIYVLGLEPGIALSQLPDWMRAFWISGRGGRMSTLKRRVQDIIEEQVIRPIYSGQKSRVERVEREYLEHLSLYNVAPNVFMFSGVGSLGRYTTAKQFLHARLGNRRFGIGPLISLSDPASIEDLYIQLLEDVLGSLGENYEAELAALRGMTSSDKVGAVLSLLEAISADDETVYIECRSGTFNEDGYLLDWAKLLIEGCAQKTRVRLVIISGRQPRRHEVAGLPNFMHTHLVSLTTDEVKALVRDVTLRSSGTAITPTTRANAAIGGHPVLAKHYAYAVGAMGGALEEKAVYEVTLTQKNMFADFLNYKDLDEGERDLLALLSWLPKVGSDLLDELCAAIPVEDHRSKLAELYLSSLVEYEGGMYSIAGPVRLVLRQLYGDGPKEVGLKVATALSRRIDADSLIFSEVIDLATYLLILFSADLSPKVRN